MSIATAITDLQGRIEDAYTALAAKGATIPATKNTYNLPSTIATVGGSEVYGIKSAEQIFGKINNNNRLTWVGVEPFDVNIPAQYPGTDIVSNYAFAYRFYGNKAIRKFTCAVTPSSSYTFSNICAESSVQEASIGLPGSNGGNVYSYGFSNCTNLTKITIGEIGSITSMNNQYGFTYMCQGCTNLTTVSFPKMTFIGTYGCQYAFRNCTSLTTVTFPKLTRIRSSAFNGAFYGCTSLTTLTFPVATSIEDYTTMANNNKLQVLNLPKVNNMRSAQSDVFTGCTDLTEIHFAAANKTAIEGASGYASKWGAPNANCTIYFDL